jgi:hypothetical protein
MLSCSEEWIEAVAGGVKTVSLAVSACNVDACTRGTRKHKRRGFRGGLHENEDVM